MSFLRDYLIYSTDNEAPEMFHVCSAYTALSASVSRKVWLPFGKRALYPNIYILLVGDAGNGKSIAMYFCKLMLSHVGDIPISGNIETPPGLWRFMGGNPKAEPPIPSPVAFLAAWPDGVVRECHPMTILANEFIDFISIDDKGWINGLNNIYDEDIYKYRTKNMGEDILLGPYIVMLGGLTTDVAHDLQKARIISTGLARRTLFQYGERRWHDPHAILKETPEQLAAFDRCVAHLKQLWARNFNGSFNWNNDTQEWWTTWYNDHTSKVLKQPPQVRSWYASKPDQVLKLGMLTSLSERLDKTLQVPDLEVAINYLSILEEDLYKIFGGVGRNELASVAVAIYEYIAAQPIPVSKRVVKNNFFAMCKPPNDFDECFTHLKVSGKVVEAIITVGTQSDVIIATPDIMKQFGVNHVINVQLADVAPSAVSQVLADAIGPSPKPSEFQLPILPTSGQVVALSGDGIVGEQPQK